MAKWSRSRSVPKIKRRVRGVSARIPIGLALIASSMAGVWWVVDEMNRLEPYLIAAVDTPAGTPLGSIEFSEVYLASPGAPLNLLRPGDETRQPERTLIAALPAGSLLSDALLHVPPPADTTVFTATLDLGGAPWLVPGAQVEVWVAAPLEDQSFSIPLVVAPNARVTGVRVDDGFAADTSRVTVDLLVDRRELPALIHARANDYSIQVSPVVAGR